MNFLVDKIYRKRIKTVCGLIMSIALIFATPITAAPGNENRFPSGDNVIYFGILPYLSSTALIKTWRPLADYIGRTLHKKVIIKTAPNFLSFLERTAEGRYDLLMTAPHFAALAVKNHGYRIIAGHGNELTGDLVVAETSRFQSIPDLRGKTIAMPGRLAAVSMLAELLLKQHGLMPNKDVLISFTPAHNTALIAVAEGRADAAVAVGGLYRRINASNKFAQLRRLATTKKIPHVMYIAGPAISADEITVLRHALISPVPGSPGAMAISQIKANFNGGDITIVSADALQRLRPVVSLLESQLLKNE